ncbi:hypothetical protein E6O75_ATG01562 [Venturia nashicola]|uniref:Uncharacterized protein n=1 Tax=Venturia nashicola TaxID=86259 RepID=A0A4Z1PVL9_9PEZI|nr:hypothetical protein E6O75_ATG01562 [Venturia nashicola]
MSSRHTTFWILYVVVVLILLPTRLRSSFSKGLMPGTMCVIARSICLTTGITAIILYFVHPTSIIIRIAIFLPFVQDVDRVSEQIVRMDLSPKLPSLSDSSAAMKELFHILITCKRLIILRITVITVELLE